MFIDWNRALGHSGPGWISLIMLAIIPLVIVIAYMMVTFFGWVGGCLVVSLISTTILYLNGFFFVNKEK